MSARIFIVEDQELVRESYAVLFDLDENLSICGEAATGAEALARIPAEAPDLVLADVSLPDMTGIALIEQLRERFPGLPVLALTGHDAPRFRRDALRAGARDFVSKHEGPDALLGAIHRIVS